VRPRCPKQIFPFARKPSAANDIWKCRPAPSSRNCELNVGLIIGLGQFLSTFLITGLYVRFANRELDPRAAAIRTQLESEIR